MNHNMPSRPSHQGSMHQSALFSPVQVSNHRLENVNCIIEPSRSMGGLFLGDVICLLKPELLKRHQINAVLSCIADRVNISVPMPHHKVLPLKDTLEYPISCYFEQATEWIDSMRKGGFNVLVHCHAGVSRSSTMVIAYFIRYKKWSSAEALDFVRSRRERAKPNSNFWNQLLSYESDMKNKAPMIADHSRKSQMEIGPMESKQNFNQFKRMTEPIPETGGYDDASRGISRQRVITQRGSQRPFEHEPKNVIRKRKPIFDSPPLGESRLMRREHILSCEPFSQQQNSSVLKKNEYSVLYPSKGEPSQGSTERYDQFQQNRSTLQYRVMSQQPMRVSPQPNRYTTPAQVSYSNYLAPPPATQSYVSPFELQGQYRHS